MEAGDGRPRGKHWCDMIDLTKTDYWMRYVPFLHPDSAAPFLEMAFQDYEVRTSAGSTRIKSMLSSYELSLLFALAKDYWTGAGEIVDLGCLNGVTTRCFGDGLRLNTNVDDTAKTGRIYAYDLFLPEDYQWWMASSATIHAGSVFPEFLRLNRDNLDYIVPCPGDLLRMNWGDRPIEILLVDAAKTWALNQFVVSRMFPALIPGKSVVVQQDNINFYEYWIAITMEYFADYFEPLDTVYGASGVYLAKRAIPADVAAFDLAALSPARKLQLMDQAIARARGSAVEVLKTAKVKLLIELGDPSAARKVLASVRTDLQGDRSPHDFSSIAKGCAQMVTPYLEAAERDAGRRA